MSRVPRPASPLRRARRSTIGLAFTGAILVLLVAAGLVQAVAVTVGFRDFAYDPGQAQRATADAQQSKLWFANNFWYGGFYSSADNSFNIWRLNEATQTWADSHIVVDLRDRVHGDFLFDSAANKLYVVSTKSPCTSMTNGCNDAVNVYRFSFNGAAALGSQYTLDAGFPKVIIGGLYNGVPPSTGGAETVTIAKDANLVYVAYTRRSAANAAPSETYVSYATIAAPTTFSAPFLINDGEDGQSNISAIVSFGTKVGIYYTDAHGAGADTGLFKVHNGGDAGNVWQTPETAAASSADNQASVKSDGTNVFVGYKTRASLGTAAQISLLKRDGAGTWTGRGVSDVDSANVRPQVAIDTEFNGGAGALFVIMNEAEAASANGNVYYKVAPLTGAGALTYTLTGKGVTLIDSATDNDIEDATTTKQVLNEASGLVVEATDKTSKFYLHNLIPLPAAADNAGPVGTIAINGNPTPDATKVTGVTLGISATDPNGVISMRIANSADGTTCPTSGSPALLSDPGATTFPYATSQAWTLSGGDALKRVCIQFLDHPIVGAGHWSVPVSDTIRLDTTGPAGTATINGGAASTPLGTVSVAVPATDATGVANVRLSNSAATTGGVLTTGTTFPFATPQSWTLTPGDGAKTVYVQWQDTLGTWSAVTSDSITLDSVNTTFTAVDPIRLLDSRVNNPAGIVMFTHGVPQTFQIAGRGPIPANAVAITGNVTVVGQQAAGLVSVGPTIGSNPSTSTINFPTKDVRANGVFVSLNGTGKLQAVYRASAGKKAHILLDVTGYFVVGPTGNEYFSVTPARFLDTRVNVPGGAHILSRGVPYAFAVGGRTVGGTTIPSDAVAITGNLTVTGQTKAGYLSLTPTSIPSPTTSSLNFPVGDTRANNVTAKLGAGGILYVVYQAATSGQAHAILDITGYFRNDGAGMSFVPLAPARTVDTRIDQGIVDPLQASAPKSWTVRGAGGVGSDAGAFTGNLTVIGQTKAGFVSVTPTPNANPGTSTINFPKGDVRANGLAAPVNNADGKASAVYKTAGSGNVQVIVDVTGYFH